MACALPRRSQLTRVTANGEEYVADEFRQIRTYCSPRSPEGKLLLQPNAYAHYRRRTKSQFGYWANTYSGAIYERIPSHPINSLIPQASAEALAKFRGKISKGGASLGVTLGSWKSSRDMIVNRLQPLSDLAAKRVAKGERRIRLLREKDQREPLANQVLETEFGWKPLFEDLTAAFTVLCSEYPRPVFVGAHASASYHGSSYEWLGVDSLTQATSRAHCRISAQVVVDNPNLWMLGRLGLLNPAAIVWDLIPWSFLVGMVTNVNQLVNGFYPYPGLTMVHASTTSRLRTDQIITSANWRYPGQLAGRHEFKERTLGLPDPPFKLQLRMPDFSWGTVVVLSSLLVQRFDKINKLIRVI